MASLTTGLIENTPKRTKSYLQTNACYAFGGVPSAFDTTASI